MSGLDALTRSEMDVLRFVAGHIERLGHAPALSTIARAIGKSKSTAHVRLVRLEAVGAIRRLRGKQSAIDVVMAPALPRTPDGAALQFIPAGRLGSAVHGDSDA